MVRQWLRAQMFIGMMVFVGGVGIGIVGDASIRDGSFFGNGSKLELEKVVDLLYSYSYETASFKNLMWECRIASEACVNWRNFVWGIYGEYFIRHPLRIDGPGHVVEIDESAFVRRKHNVGHPVRTQWVFGGLGTETQDGFLVAVDRRDADTLLPVLQEYVLPQTTVVSDLWGAYCIVNNLGLPVSNSKPQASFHWSSYSCNYKSCRINMV